MINSETIITVHSDRRAFKEYLSQAQAQNIKYYYKIKNIIILFWPDTFRSEKLRRDFLRLSLLEVITSKVVYKSTVLVLSPDAEGLLVSFC